MDEREEVIKVLGCAEALEPCAGRQPVAEIRKVLVEGDRTFRLNEPVQVGDEVDLELAFLRR